MKKIIVSTIVIGLLLTTSIASVNAFYMEESREDSNLSTTNIIELTQDEFNQIVADLKYMQEEDPSLQAVEQVLKDVVIPDENGVILLDLEAFEDELTQMVQNIEGPESYIGVQAEPDDEEIILNNWTGSYEFYANEYIEPYNAYCHIPVVLGDQSPLIFDNVWSEPSGEVAGFSVAHGYSGSNTLLNVSMKSLDAGQSVKIFWSALSLVKSKNYEDLPTYLKIVPEDELPDDVKEWLLPTEFIQSNHWRIKLVARCLRGFTDDVVKIAKRVTFFTGKIIIYLPYGKQDALSTLRRHFAVCTGKANLAAALLRANGIPARVLMVYPTHYIIEYYAHPYGWVRSESTIGVMPYPNQYYTVAFCAYPEDETSNPTGGYPGGGVIAYWGVSNPKVTFGINYEEWAKAPSHDILTSEEKVDESIALAKEAWGYYSKYVGTNLSPSQMEFFQKALSYEKTAISNFEENNIDGYIGYIYLAIDEYAKIDDDPPGLYTNQNSLSSQQGSQASSSQQSQSSSFFQILGTTTKQNIR